MSCGAHYPCLLPGPCAVPAAAVWRRWQPRDGRELRFSRGRWTSHSWRSWSCWPGGHSCKIESGEIITSPNILWATGSPLLRMLLSSMSSSSKLSESRSLICIKWGKSWKPCIVKHLNNLSDGFQLALFHSHPTVEAPAHWSLLWEGNTKTKEALMFSLIICPPDQLPSYILPRNRENMRVGLQ